MQNSKTFGAIRFFILSRVLKKGIDISSYFVRPSTPTSHLPVMPLIPPPSLLLCLPSSCPHLSSYLVGQDVDPLLQVAIF